MACKRTSHDPNASTLACLNLMHLILVFNLAVMTLVILG